jgi:hypothetical protein
MNTPLEKLIKHFGNSSNAAHELRAAAVKIYGDNSPNFDRQMVHNWQSRGSIPWKHGELIERATDGAISKQEVWEAAAMINSSSPRVSR